MTTFNHWEQVRGAAQAFAYMWQETVRRVHPDRELSIDIRSTALAWYITVAWWDHLVISGGPDFLPERIQREATFKMTRDKNISFLSGEMDKAMECIPEGAPEQLSEFA